MRWPAKLVHAGGLCLFGRGALGPEWSQADLVIVSSGLSVALAKWLTSDAVSDHFLMEGVQVTDSTIRQARAIRPAPRAFRV